MHLQRAVAGFALGCPPAKTYPDNKPGDYGRAIPRIPRGARLASRWGVREAPEGGLHLRARLAALRAFGGGSPDNKGVDALRISG